MKWSILVIASLCVACGGGAAGSPAVFGEESQSATSTERAADAPAGERSRERSDDDLGIPRRAYGEPADPDAIVGRPGPKDCWKVADVIRMSWKDPGRRIHCLEFDSPYCGPELSSALDGGGGGLPAVEAEFEKAEQRSKRKAKELDADPDIEVSARCRTEYAWTPLHMAAMQGDEAVTEFLLRKGGDPSACDMTALTPLHYAVREHNVEVVELLVEAGAYVDAVNLSGERPLHRAVDLDPLEIDEDNPEYDEEDAAEEKEWYAGSLRIVELLLEAGADVALTDAEGQTPLHIAAYRGNLEVVKLLIAHGAPLDVADADGKKPLGLTDDEEIKAVLSAI